MLFYVIIYTALIIYFTVRNGNKLIGVLFATLVTLIGSEYWELPILLAGYVKMLLGIGQHTPDNLFYHATVLSWFLLLLYISEFKWTKLNVILLALGPFCTGIIIAMQIHTAFSFFARAIGFIFLTYVFSQSQVKLHARTTAVDT